MEFNLTRNYASYDDWVNREIMPAMIDLSEDDFTFFNNINVRRMLLAMIKVESKAQRYDGPTKLAAVYHNITGYKFLERNDQGRYEKVVMDANQFDAAPTVAYRVYRSYEHALRNLRWALLRSSFYKGFVNYGDVRGWLAKVGAVWCNENPEHVKTLLELYDEYSNVRAS